MKDPVGILKWVYLKHGTYHTMVIDYIDREKAIATGREYELTDHGDWVHLTWLDDMGLLETGDIIYLAYIEPIYKTVMMSK